MTKFINYLRLAGFMSERLHELFDWFLNGDYRRGFLDYRLEGSDSSVSGHINLVTGSDVFNVDPANELLRTRASKCVALQLTSKALADLVDAQSPVLHVVRGIEYFDSVYIHDEQPVEAPDVRALYLLPNPETARVPLFIGFFNVALTSRSSGNLGVNFVVKNVALDDVKRDLTKILKSLHPVKSTTEQISNIRDYAQFYLSTL